MDTKDLYGLPLFVIPFRLIHSFIMTRAEYDKSRFPKQGSPEDKGYLLQYRHNNRDYVTWAPESEVGHLVRYRMDGRFPEVLLLALEQDGICMQRHAWDTQKYAYFVTPEDKAEPRHLVVRDERDSTVQPWTPSPKDIIAADWYILMK